MFKIDLSQLEYNVALAHLASGLIGIFLLIGIGICDPRIHSEVKWATDFDTGLLIAISILLCVVAYCSGAVVFAVVANVTRLLELSFAPKATDSTLAIPSSWRAIVGTLLRSLGVPEPADKEWSQWVPAIHALSFEQQVAPTRTMIALVTGIGVVCGALLLAYPAARISWIIALCASSIVTGVFWSWILAQNYVAGKLLVLQQVGILRLLIKTRLDKKTSVVSSKEES